MACEGCRRRKELLKAGVRFIRQKIEQAKDPRTRKQPKQGGRRVIGGVPK